MITPEMLMLAIRNSEEPLVVLVRTDNDLHPYLIEELTNIEGKYGPTMYCRSLDEDMEPVKHLSSFRAAQVESIVGTLAEAKRDLVPPDRNDLQDAGRAAVLLAEATRTGLPGTASTAISGKRIILTMEAHGAAFLAGMLAAHPLEDTDG